VRDDPKIGESFKKNKTFEVSTGKEAAELAGDYWGQSSLSGNERNRLFLSDSGKSFSDVSLISGADHRGDGRSVVLLDYDRDGRMDIASINTNAPKLVLYRNEVPSTYRFAAFQFFGSNNKNATTPEASNRDGYGTRIVLELDGRTIVEELRAGVGFSAQNSKTLLIGLGEAKTIPLATVFWPSGKKTEYRNLPVDQLIAFSESSSEFTRKPYKR
jgi:enediyne biosynthesis protein E4